ncbi:hypothetical protein ACWDYH_36285 [Nocardia goodfellowii]
MSTSNPAGAGEPIDQPGFSWDYQRPVAVGLAITTAGIAVVRARFDRTAVLDLDEEQDFRLGYEVIGNRTQPLDSAAVAKLERRLAQWELHADVLAGHVLGPGLKELCAVTQGQPLRALAQLSEEWPNREHRPPGSRPALIDTALDIAGAHQDLERTCASADGLHSRNLDPHARSAWMPIARAAAAVLLSARHLGWCRWPALDLDEMITRSNGAWWARTH